MGYDYTIQGWFRAGCSIDATLLDDPLPADPHQRHFTAARYARVLGRRRNHLLFSTRAGGISDHYIDLAARLAASHPGTGFFPFTGEISHDGKDRFFLANEAQLRAIPLFHLYDPASPWNTLYNAFHYMERDGIPTEPTPLEELANSLLRSTSINCWLCLKHDQHDDSREPELIERFRALPGLESATDFMSHYCEPTLLIGEDDVDPIPLLAQLAGVTAELPGTYAHLFCSDLSADPASPREFLLLIMNGDIRILPALPLTPPPDSPVSLHAAYPRLQDLAASFPLSPALSLPGLYAAIRDALYLPPDPPPHAALRRDAWHNSTFHFATDNLTVWLFLHEGRPTLYLWPYAQATAADFASNVQFSFHQLVTADLAPVNASMGH